MFLFVNREIDEETKISTVRVIHYSNQHRTIYSSIQFVTESRSCIGINITQAYYKYNYRNDSSFLLLPQENFELILCYVSSVNQNNFLLQVIHS